MFKYLLKTVELARKEMTLWRKINNVGMFSADVKGLHMDPHLVICSTVNVFVSFPGRALRIYAYQPGIYIYSRYTNARAGAIRAGYNRESSLVNAQSGDYYKLS